jgi:predicted dehydrogenase
MSSTSSASATPPLPRVAVVGALGFGLNHLRAFRELADQGRCTVSAVVDMRPLDGEAAELAGDATTYRDLADLLATEPPEVVVIATPIPTHAPLAAAAMRAGSHVLLEKPPTASLAEFTELLDVSRETGRACQVGFQSNGSDAYAVVADAVAAGEIGEVTGIGVVGTWLRPVSYYARARWAGRRRLDGVDVVDGVVTNPLAHAVTAALRVGGASRAEDVAVVETELFHAHDIEADDTSAVRILTTHGPKGLPIALGLTVCAPTQSEPRILVHGTAGRITFRYKTDVVEVDGASGRRTVQCASASLQANLLDHLRDPSVALLSPLEESGGFMRVLEAIRTAPDPAPIPEHLVEWRGEGPDRHPVVRDVEHWCTRVATELRPFSALGAPWAPQTTTLATLTVRGGRAGAAAVGAEQDAEQHAEGDTDEDVEVARYVDGAGASALDSPHPHLHPVRTLGGVVVTDAAPADHTWHTGVSLAVQDVAGHNLWGGRTYLTGRGYTWQPDHGRITHEGWEPGEPGAAASDDDGVPRIEHLAWRGHDGRVLLTETRTLRSAAAADGWELGLVSTLANPGDTPVPLGSPGTHGSSRGGYGGFFWRFPPCTDVDVRTAHGRGEAAVHGSVAPWLAWSATAPDGDFTVVVAGATPETAADPWFVRVTGANYPGLGSALAWSQPLVVPPGGAVTRAFRVLVADGRLTDAAAAAAGERLAGRSEDVVRAAASTRPAATVVDAHPKP